MQIVQFGWVVSSFAVAIALAGITQAVRAEPGLNGSYLGVAVDGQDLGNRLPSLLQAVNQQNWVFDEAIRQFKASDSQSAQPAAPATSNDAIGSQFQGRLDLPNRFSLRGSAFVSDGATAVIPSLTYDVPVSAGTNVYAGAGYAVVNTGTGGSTPLGDQNGVVLTTGIEAAAGKNLVIFGDTKLNLNHDRASGSNPLRFQFGAGIRF